MPVGLTGVKLHLIDSVDEASALMRWLSERRPSGERIALDTECTGLDRWRDHVRLVQFGDEHHGWAVPWERWGGVVEEVVQRYTGEWVMHNLTYDYPMLINSCGITLPPNRCHDTRIMGHLLHPTESTALKKLSARYVDAGAAGLSQQLDDVLSGRDGWTWATVPVTYEPYWSYGALDAVLTAQLDTALRPIVMNECPAAYDIERAVSFVCVQMSRNGAHIDRAYTAAKYDSFMRYVNETEQWCIDTYGVRPGQSASIIERMTADGIEFTKATASGAISLDKEVLGSIDHPLARAVLSRRQVQKIASTYLKNFLELSDEHDLLHPNINPLGFHQERTTGDSFGVRTSRMSMDSPNLQNLTRYEPGVETPANVVRNCVTARDGRVLLMADFDQVEARLIAHLTGDPGFISAFREGDFFVNITRALWDDDSVVKGDPRRQATKNGVYARAYGAGVTKFAKTTGTSVEAASALYQRLDQLYPGWNVFTRTVEDTARERLQSEGKAYVRSPLTGRRYVCDESKLYVLVNFLIQGTAAEVLKMKLIELSAAGLDEFMILPVHDEVILDVPLDSMDDAVRTTASIMNDDTLFSVPLTASMSKGARWGEKVEL